LLNLVGAVFSSVFGTCRDSKHAGKGAAGGFIGAGEHVVKTNLNISTYFGVNVFIWYSLTNET